MIRIIILFIMLFCVSCKVYDTLQPEWARAPQIYKCSEQEMKRVIIETEWCNKETDYNSQYCFGTALIRLCKK